MRGMITGVFMHKLRPGRDGSLQKSARFLFSMLHRIKLLY